MTLSLRDAEFVRHAQEFAKRISDISAADASRISPGRRLLVSRGGRP